MAIEGKDRKAFYQMQVLADSAFIFLVVKLKVQKAKSIDTVGEIEKFDNVESVFPMIEKQLLASSGRAAEGAMVRGMRKEDILNKETLKNGMLNVNMEEFTGNNVIILRCKRTASKSDFRKAAYHGCIHYLQGYSYSNKPPLDSIPTL